jgi:hypothetical protein
VLDLPLVVADQLFGHYLVVVASKDVVNVLGVLLAKVLHVGLLQQIPQLPLGLADFAFLLSTTG